MLPELKEDLDNIQLDTCQFESYHSLLIQDLPKLYDLVQEFLQKSGDAGHEELRVKLLLLICELTASPTIYQLKDDSDNLLRNANELARKLSSYWWESTDVQVLKYYERKLHRDCWKKQLGAVHGFGRYLEDPKDIQELNVHSVIYDHALKDAYNMESIEAIDSVWNCLYLCLDHFVDLDAFTPKEIEVQSVIKHPAFRMDNFQNDVALLILQQWFELDAHINVICLPDHGANPPRKSECYANGWGKDGFRDLGQSIAIMKRVPFHVVGFSECRDRILKDASDCRPEFCLSRSTLCAEGQISVDMCHGDGGGPLACPIGDRYQLSGVMSFGIKCNGIGSGYANVALVRNWIDQELTAIGLDISYYSAESSLLTI
uniref:GG15641 n=1 Tax=Drosophila erecta TaxID=7220 RepID=B3P1S7_DROER